MTPPRKGGLDALEQSALAGRDEFEKAGIYELIFEALNNGPTTSLETIFNWGQRYIARATSPRARDGFLST